MSTLQLRLYRTLLQRARHFDANPAMKGILKDLHHFEPLCLRPLYSPSMQKSFVQLVKQVFRQPRKEGIDEELGFNVLRYLNQVDAKFFRALYPSAAEGIVARATAITTSALPALTTLISASVPRNPMLKRLSRAGDRYWALPIPVPDSPPVAGLKEIAALVPMAPGPSSPSEVPRDCHPLTPGVVLATHPLSEWPFGKCSMLVIEAGPDFVSALILNYPRMYPVGERNYVFPPGLRQQSCHVGGPVLSYEMPPIPNYFILHPHSSVPKAKVLIPDANRPICVSTGEDIAAITEFLRQRKASAEDFVIFAGSVIVPTAELQRQVQEGFWMPILASAEFVHASGRLGRLFWDGLMESCGGEFAHMPLISSLVESQGEDAAQ